MDRMQKNPLTSSSSASAILEIFVGESGMISEGEMTSIIENAWKIELTPLEGRLRLPRGELDDVYVCRASCISTIVNESNYIPRYVGFISK